MQQCHLHTCCDVFSFLMVSCCSTGEVPSATCEVPSAACEVTSTTCEVTRASPNVVTDCQCAVTLTPVGSEQGGGATPVISATRPVSTCRRVTFYPCDRGFIPYRTDSVIYARQSQPGDKRIYIPLFRSLSPAMQPTCLHAVSSK